MGTEFGLVFVWLVELFNAVMCILAIIAIDALLVVFDIVTHFLFIEVTRPNSVF